MSFNPALSFSVFLCLAQVSKGPPTDAVANITAPDAGSDICEDHQNFCTLRPLSPEDALEEKLLLNSISWPVTVVLPESFSLEQTTDPAHSAFTVPPRAGGGQWRVGDQLKVHIQMRDFRGLPKTSGGDVLLARMHNSALGASVAGQVVDHQNGSYSAIFSLLWDGSARVEVRRCSRKSRRQNPVIIKSKIKAPCPV